MEVKLTDKLRPYIADDRYFVPNLLGLYHRVYIRYNIKTKKFYVAQTDKRKNIPGVIIAKGYIDLDDPPFTRDFFFLK